MENQCQHHAAHKQSIETHDKRLDAHGDELDRIAICLERLTVLQENQEKRQCANEQDVAALKSAPAKKWEQISQYVLTALIGAVIGFVLSNIGL